MTSSARSARSARTIARWESKSGKHWVEVYADGTYHAPRCGGNTCLSEADAIAYVQRLVDGGGYFQPDAAKTPMRRVI